MSDLCAHARAECGRIMSRRIEWTGEPLRPTYISPNSHSTRRLTYGATQHIDPNCTMLWHRGPSGERQSTGIVMLIWQGEVPRHKQCTACFKLRQPPLRVQQEMATLYKLYLSIPAIAEKTEWSENAVRNALVRQGVELRTAGQSSGRLLKLSKEECERARLLYENIGKCRQCGNQQGMQVYEDEAECRQCGGPVTHLSQLEVANILGISVSSVRKRLGRAGVVSRPRGANYTITREEKVARARRSVATRMRRLAQDA